MAKTIITTIALCLSLIACAPPAAAQEPWYETENTGIKIAGNLLILADWNQTRHVAGHPDEYYEINEILGRHPSKRRVNAYFLGVLAVLNGADLLLGPKASNGLWIGVVAVEGATVARNAGLGIRIRF